MLSNSLQVPRYSVENPVEIKVEFYFYKYDIVWILLRTVIRDQIIPKCVKSSV